jgi:hypothetical protein
VGDRAPIRVVSARSHNPASVLSSAGEGPGVSLVSA